MCGIFGYLGKRRAVPIVLDGLSRLEYRGYDSAGIALVDSGELVLNKTLGQVSVLAEVFQGREYPAQMAIGHTRWATHGEPSVTNAHPHVDQHNSCAVVHNGIIENYKELRSELLERGVVFRSETDSEVIAQLFALHYAVSKDLVFSFSLTLSQLKGTFACALLHKDYPETLLCAAQESPLLLGLGEDEVFLASDVHAFSKYTNSSQALSSGELAVIRSGKGIETYNFSLQKIEKEVRLISCLDAEIGKDGYNYYMLKEIYEQPDIFSRLTQKYLSECGDLQESFLPELSLKDFDSIHIVACGSSYHAGFLAKYLMESLAGIPVQVEIASEFRYRDAYIGENSLVILISQSGETADTLAALREFRRKEVKKILGICNVQGSALALGVDECLFLEVGIEVGVASTKAFSSQLLLLILLGMKCAKERQTCSVEELREIGLGLRELPSLSRRLLRNDKLLSWARAYKEQRSFIFLGRRFMYPICMEAALKLKEIAYVEANAYPAGEMKHGPIALISKGSTVIAFCGDSYVYNKMVGSIMEVKARQAHVVALAPESNKDIAAVSDEQILIPDSHIMATPILYAMAGQVMAYHIALQNGLEIDKPRNLAKSVTVE